MAYEHWERFRVLHGDMKSITHINIEDNNLSSTNWSFPEVKKEDISLPDS